MMKNNVSALSRVNYVWQSFSLLVPIYVLLHTIIQSFVDMNLQGFIIFSVMIGAILCNELLSGYGVLAGSFGQLSTNKSYTCGLLNFNKNFIMTNSTIILSFALGFYGLNMYFVKKTNIAFLILLSFFLLMDIIYYILICSGDGMIMRLIASILFGGVFGITWSSIHNAIFDNKNKGGKKETTYTVSNNGQEVAQGITPL
jgi:hypothetical protein